MQASLFSVCDNSVDQMTVMLGGTGRIWVVNPFAPMGKMLAEISAGSWVGTMRILPPSPSLLCPSVFTKLVHTVVSTFQLQSTVSSTMNF